MKDHDTEHARHTVRAVSLGTFLRILRYPFVLLSVAIIPRMMGDATYGKYAYFMSVFLILDIFSDIGFLQIFGRFIPECEASGEHEKAKNLLHGILAFALILTAVLITAVCVVHAVHPIQGFSWHWIVILSAVLLFTQIEGILFSHIYGLNQIARFSAKEIMRSAFTFFLVVGLFFFFDIEGALWGVALHEFLLMVMALIWTREHVFCKWEPINPRWIWPYLFFGIQFYIPAFLFGMMQRSGNVFVQMFTHSSEQVAYFDVANQFLLLASSFLGLLLATLVPSLTKLHIRKERETIERWQGTAMTYCGVIAFLAYNALMWLGDHVIGGWLGEEFLPVMDNAMVIVLAMAPMLIAYVGMNYTVLEKEPGVYTKGVTLGIVVMIVTCAVLIPRMNAVGASWASLAGYSTLGAYFYYKYRRQFSALLKRFGAVVVVGACLSPAYWIKANLTMSVMLFLGTSLAYVALLAAFRVVRWSDVQKIRASFLKPDAA
ncbi:MAG: oligosaccharide flippase family protein [Verrucomicrobia bacterium]|nr:oligosaccharide flippase family protein [Verrucomicrobiota bacterium]